MNLTVKFSLFQIDIFFEYFNREVNFYKSQWKFIMTGSSI